jgi:Zn-dependent protease with chaperone function
MNTEENPTTPRPRFNWVLFFAALLGPLILTLLFALAQMLEAAVPIMLFGSAVGGIVCGAMLGQQLGKTRGVRVGLSLLFSVVFVVVCLVMSFFSCLALVDNMRH